MTFSRSFKYHTFTKKCEEFLIVLHSLYEKLPNRVFVREVGGMKMPFIWIPRHELLKEVTYQDRTLVHVINFLSDHGIIIIEKADFVTRLNTNCYTINYKVLQACLKEWGYTPKGIKPHADKAPLEALFDFDVIEIIKKIPGYKQRPGRHMTRKGVVNRRGNCKPKALLEDPESPLTRVFCTSINPLRGYLNLNVPRCENLENTSAHTRLRTMRGARYATLCYKEDVDSLGELIYQMGLTLEKLVKGASTGCAYVMHTPQFPPKRWQELNRPKRFFRLVGAIFKKELFYPSRENFNKFSVWIKENVAAANLTEALKFKNILLFAKTLKRRHKRQKMISCNTQSATHMAPPPQTLNEKMEELQYEIANNPHETRLQKEARLAILEKIGPSQYASWIKNLPFDGESDYCFLVENPFYRDYLTQRFSFDFYKFDIGRRTLQIYRDN